jgi:ABC-type oligopeptide transport system substrate-binding subunit
VLFSIKAIKCPLVNAPFLRVYFDSVVDARLLGEFTIQFSIKEPYFLNESVLGGIDVLPRHYYDPGNLLKDVTLADLRKPADQLFANIKKFADDFNKNFSRNPMGSGPYKFKAGRPGVRSSSCATRNTGAMAKRASTSLPGPLQISNY